MAQVLLTKRIEFSAAHRYINEAWDEARNRAAFGACFNAPGHGHNYMLEVTVAGTVDPQTGMVVNLTDLKHVLKAVLEEFDHKHLNLDTPYFHDKVPTTENIAAVLWTVLTARTHIGRLEKIRLFEDDDLYAVVVGAGRQASLTRRYHFSAAHRLESSSPGQEKNRPLSGPCSQAGAHGHNYTLHVTVAGDIDATTGMVTDLAALDQTVRERILRRVDHQDLNRDPDLENRVTTGDNLVGFFWDILVKSVSGGRLERVGLAETQDTYFECAR